ncbi:MAG: nuclear transport factor 2 family protein [Acidimicrobiia bacterium]|nr:nuclear transport factor 2 family protein [Acidimicrobiia bacterium]
MSTSAVEIANLLFRYAELMDGGDFVGASQLFAHAEIIVDPTPGAARLDAAGILAVWEQYVVRYDDGTPRTKHVVTNPIIEIDEDADRAAARSYYTVFQQVGAQPIQPIVAGRYHDRFERVAGQWRFCERDYSLMDLIGDLSAHMTMEL